MKAAGQRGIPCSFVVDGAGKLAYIGHPMYLDFPLEGLVAGTWDPVAGGKRIADANRRLGALDKEIMADTDEGRAAVAAFCKEFPMLAQTVELMSFQVLLDAKKYDRASAVAASLVDKAVAAKDASALNGIAWPLVDPENAIERRDLELAMKAATKAVEISKEKDGNILDTLARVWFWKKDYQKALELQRKAVQVGDNPDLKKALAEYEKLVAEGAKKDGQ
jgi:tetratricopeptide (TPR) repeat protein